MCCITADRSLLLNEFWKGSRCLFLTGKTVYIWLPARIANTGSTSACMLLWAVSWLRQSERTNCSKEIQQGYHDFFTVQKVKEYRERLVWKLSDASSLNICIKLYTDTSNVDKQEVKFKKCRDFSVRHIRPPISTNKREQQPCFCLNNCWRKLSVTSEDVLQVLVGVQGSSHRFMQSCY